MRQDGVSSPGSDAHFLSSFKSWLIVQLVDITVPTCQHSSGGGEKNNTRYLKISLKMT